MGGGRRVEGRLPVSQIYISYITLSYITVGEDLLSVSLTAVIYSGFILRKAQQWVPSCSSPTCGGGGGVGG